MPKFESFGGSVNKKEKSAEKEVLPADLEPNSGEMSPEAMKDYLFDQYLKQQLVEEFFDNLSEYLDDKEVDEMRAVLSEYDDKDVYATLSLPHELRERKFSEFQKKIEDGTKEAGQLMQDFVQSSTQYGFSIGYHTSPHDIKPSESGQWIIKGYENDHRDNDLSRAYYSTKYRHLFKKKDPKFIYIVRTDPSTHKTDGNWSRAGSLSVVAKVPFPDVVNYVENTVQDMEKKKADNT